LVESRLIERDKKKTEQGPKFRVGDAVQINLPQGRNTFDKNILKWSKEKYPPCSEDH